MITREDLYRKTCQPPILSYAINVHDLNNLRSTQIGIPLQALELRLNFAYREYDNAGL